MSSNGRFQFFQTDLEVLRHERTLLRQEVTLLRAANATLRDLFLNRQNYMDRMHADIVQLSERLEIEEWRVQFLRKEVERLHKEREERSLANNNS